MESLVFAAFLTAPAFGAFDDAPQAAPLTYAECRQRALAEGKPLVCWVGTGDVVCPACVKQLAAEAVHHVTPTFPGVTGNAIVVAVPEGGELLRVADVTRWTTGDPSWGHVPSVRRAIQNWRTHRRVIRSGWSTDIVSNPPQAVFQLADFYFAPRPGTTPVVPATSLFVPTFAPRPVSFRRGGG